MSLQTLATCIRSFRVAGWLCVAVLVWLSWIPKDWEVRTSLAGQIEHAIAYCGTAAIFAVAYQETRRWWMASGFVVLAGILEAGQLWVPGRTAQVLDFAASSAGAVAGVLIGRVAIETLISWLMRPSR
ncbi:VanZ family protein [Methylobacterium oxalidis]|uniref:VanZ family protein n=1 Tax=Methylobacterium oxalidis TaxID=944322 RepID=UPI0033155D43